jgi:hypothetical protein
VKKNEKAVLKGIGLVVRSLSTLLRKERRESLEPEGGPANALRGYATPGVFASSVRKRLKTKGLVKTPEPSVRKRIERKELGEFLCGQEDGGMPEGVQEASS